MAPVAQVTKDFGVCEFYRQRWLEFAGREDQTCPGPNKLREPLHLDAAG